MTRRRLSGNNAATALLAEVQPSDRRTPREEALLVLRFFGPINPALKTLPALLLLRDEFGAQLNSASWLEQRIKALEAQP